MNDAKVKVRSTLVRSQIIDISGRSVCISFSLCAQNDHNGAFPGALSQFDRELKRKKRRCSKSTSVTSYVTSHKVGNNNVYTWDGNVSFMLQNKQLQDFSIVLNGEVT